MSYIQNSDPDAPGYWHIPGKKFAKYLWGGDAMTRVWVRYWHESEDGQTMYGPRKLIGTYNDARASRVALGYRLAGYAVSLEPLPAALMNGAGI